MNVIVRRYYQPPQDRWEVEYWKDDQDFRNVQTFKGPNAEYNARELAQRLKRE
jgi:hypothetical protein